MVQMRPMAAFFTFNYSVQILFHIFLLMEIKSGVH